MTRKRKQTTCNFHLFSISGARFRVIRTELGYSPAGLNLAKPQPLLLLSATPLASKTAVPPSLTAVASPAAALAAAASPAANAIDGEPAAADAIAVEAALPLNVAS